MNSINSGSVSFNVQQQTQSRSRISIIAGVWDKIEKFGSKNSNTVMIHPDFLRKMHDHPSLGGQYETKIRDYASSTENGRIALDAVGLWMASSGLYIDENGATEKNGVMQAYVSVASKYEKAEPGTVRTILGTTKVPPEEMEALRKQIEEERESRLIDDPDPSAGGGAAKAEGDASFTVDTTV